MAAYLIRRVISILVMAFLVAFVSFMLLSIAPGGPLQEIASRQSTTQRNDLDLVERTMKRYDLDIYLLPRFTRWLTGHPRGPIEIGGQVYFSDMQVGCLKEGKSQLVYSDGRVVELDCEKPVFLGDLSGRPASNGILSLDFGRSTQILRERPVMQLFESRILNTLLLMGLSTLLSLAIAIPLGIISAVRQYSRFDYAVTTVAFIGSGMPTLFLGILGILVFAILFKELGLPYLPAGTDASPRDTVIPIFGTIQAGSFIDKLWHLVLPVAVLTFVGLAQWSRFIRSSMLEVLRQDYVRTARAKGLVEKVVIVKHAMRNALIPFVTLLAGVLPALFGGAIITEAVFNYPGMGRLFIASLTAGDYNVAIAFILISTFLVLIGYLISDVLYTMVDPRIRLS
jgi:peptide/nickel transport system permease protein